jgi:hypothetical protein
MTPLGDEAMEVGQTAMAPWEWQPCHDQTLQPQWMALGTFVTQGDTTDSVADCYLAYTHDSAPQDLNVSTRLEQRPVLEVEQIPDADYTHRRRRQRVPHEGLIRAVRGQISPADWARRRPEITELYRHRDWTLPRVMEEMARRGFYAS